MEEENGLYVWWHSISSKVNILGMISKGFQFRRREWLSGRLGQVLYLWIQRDWV